MPKDDPQDRKESSMNKHCLLFTTVFLLLAASVGVQAFEFTLHAAGGGYYGYNWVSLPYWSGDYRYASDILADIPGDYGLEIMQVDVDDCALHYYDGVNYTTDWEIYDAHGELLNKRSVRIRVSTTCNWTPKGCHLLCGVVPLYAEGTQGHCVVMNISLPYEASSTTAYALWNELDAAGFSPDYLEVWDDEEAGFLQYDSLSTEEDSFPIPPGSQVVLQVLQSGNWTPAIQL
jgi:hypothetical protein